MKKLQHSRIKPADFVRTVYRVNAEHGTTVEDLQRPEYWSHVSAQLKVGDIVEVAAEDNAFFAVFLVVAATQQFAKVELLSEKVMEARKPKDDLEEHPDYERRWMGPRGKFSIFRRVDNVEMAKELPDKAAVRDWLEQHGKAV